MKSLISRKIGMTSIVANDGVVEAVTLLSVSDNVVTQIKTNEIDGYDALQMGFETTKKSSKPAQGHFKTLKNLPKIVKEFRITENTEQLKIGDTLSVDLFKVGDKVHATGVSKGKGFAGTIKRHNFHRGRKTHGAGSYRRPGSIGSMYPQKIFKGKKMAGQMGNVRVTVKNLDIVLVDPELKVIGVKGAIPGPKKGIVLIRSTEK